MIFKFPKKKITLDCFTTKAYVIECAPIVPAIKLVPDWWKNIPNQDAVYTLTMRHCAGMVDYYKKSVAIPLWASMAITVGEDKHYSWMFSDHTTEAVVHDTKIQAPNFLNDYGHLKITSPWLLKCKEDINWVWSHPTYDYANNNQINSFPAITNFYYQHQTHINTMVSLEKPQTIVIPQGQILTMLTPMSDRKVEVIRHLVSDDEYKRLQNRNLPTLFKNSYANYVARINQFKDCPYRKGN